jgi:CheY-like chemotaxis protein
MRALIVADDSRPIGELQTLLAAQGFEHVFVSASAPELVTLAAGAKLVFLDLRDGALQAEHACARLKELGDEGTFNVLYGEVPAIQEVEHLLDGRAHAFLIPDAPMNHSGSVRSLAPSPRARVWPPW